MTPGPWKHEVTEATQAGLDHVIDGPHVPVAWAYRADDARLIAAAPDLLEACKAAMSVLSGECRDDIEPGSPSGAAMNLLAAAIRKATT